MRSQYIKCEQVVEQVYQKLTAMPQEEFNGLLEKYEDHYIAELLEETQALDIKIIEEEYLSRRFRWIAE